LSEAIVLADPARSLDNAARLRDARQGAAGRVGMATVAKTLNIVARPRFGAGAAFGTRL